VQTDLVLPLVVHAAEELGDVSLAFHLEPYPGRTAVSTREDLQYLQQQYSTSPAILRIRVRQEGPLSHLARHKPHSVHSWWCAHGDLRCHKPYAQPYYDDGHGCIAFNPSASLCNVHAISELTSTRPITIAQYVSTPQRCKH
jgi:hypothetical protein